MGAESSKGEGSSKKTSRSSSVPARLTSTLSRSKLLTSLSKQRFRSAMEMDKSLKNSSTLNPVPHVHDGKQQETTAEALGLTEEELRAKLEADRYAKMERNLHNGWSSDYIVEAAQLYKGPLQISYSHASSDSPRKRDSNLSESKDDLNLPRAKKRSKSQFVSYTSASSNETEYKKAEKLGHFEVSDHNSFLELVVHQRERQTESSQQLDYPLPKNHDLMKKYELLTWEIQQILDDVIFLPIVPQKIFIVEMDWWKRFRESCLISIRIKNAEMPKLRSVNNAKLLDPEYPEKLRGDLVREYDYVMVPARAWMFIKRTYDGGPTIERYIIEKSSPLPLYPYPVFELYPPLATVYRVMEDGVLSPSPKRLIMNNVDGYNAIESACLSDTCGSYKYVQLWVQVSNKNEEKLWEPFPKFGDRYLEEVPVGQDLTFAAFYTNEVDWKWIFPPLEWRKNLKVGQLVDCQIKKWEECTVTKVLPSSVIVVSERWKNEARVPLDSECLARVHTHTSRQWKADQETLEYFNVNRRFKWQTQFTWCTILMFKMKPHPLLHDSLILRELKSMIVSEVHSFKTCKKCVQAASQVQ